MPTYSPLGVSATLAVTDLQQSLSTNIYSGYSLSTLKEQRADLDGIKAAFKTASELPEEPIYDIDKEGDGKDMEGRRYTHLVHFVNFGAPLMICEAGQKLRPALKPEPTLTSGMGEEGGGRGRADTPSVPQQGLGQEDGREGNTPEDVEMQNVASLVPPPESSPLSSLGATPTAASLTKALSRESSMLSSVDTNAVEEVVGKFTDPPPSSTLPQRRTRQMNPVTPQSAARARQVNEASISSRFPASSPHPLPTPAENPTPKNGDSGISGESKAICVILDISPSAYIPAIDLENLNAPEKAQNLKVEVFVNGSLTGSCYINSKMSRASAVECVDGRFIFTGRRIHRQLEKALIYIPNLSNDLDEVGDLAHSTATGRVGMAEKETAEAEKLALRWHCINKALEDEANCRGWSEYTKRKLQSNPPSGFATPSADFLRALAKLAVPPHLSNKSGLAAIDVIISAGTGGKSHGVQEVYIKKPLRMGDKRYKVSNQSIASMIAAFGAVGGNVMTGRDEQPETGRAPRDQIQAGKAQQVISSDAVTADLAMTQSEPTAPGITGPPAKRHIPNVFQSSPQQGPRTQSTVMNMSASPTPKRRNTSAVPSRYNPNSFNPDKKAVSHADLIAEFDVTLLDPSRIDLEQNLRLETTRHAPSTRTLRRRLVNLRQMSSSNRLSQVQLIEQILGQDLLVMLRNAMRKDSGIAGVARAGEMDEVQDEGRVPLAGYSGIESRLGNVRDHGSGTPNALSQDTTLANVSSNQLFAKTGQGSHGEPEVNTPAATSRLPPQATAPMSFQSVRTPTQFHNIGMMIQSSASPSARHGRLVYQAKQYPWISQSFTASATDQRPIAPERPTLDFTPAPMQIPVQPINSVHQEKDGKPRTLRRSTINASGSLDLPPQDVSTGPTSQGGSTRHFGSFDIVLPKETMERTMQRIASGQAVVQTSRHSTRPKNSQQPAIDITKSAQKRRRLTKDFPNDRPSPKIKITPRKHALPPTPTPGAITIPNLAPTPQAAAANSKTKGRRILHEATPEEAIRDFVVPEASRGSVVSFSEDASNPMFRQIGKARDGTFSETEVVVGFRFYVV